MKPTIENNDIILVSTYPITYDNIISDQIYVVIHEGVTRVKRLRKKVDHVLELISDNPIIQNESIPEEHLNHINIVGQVRWFGRSI